MFKLILIQNYLGGHYFSQFLEDTTLIVGSCMTGALRFVKIYVLHNDFNKK